MAFPEPYLDAIRTIPGKTPREKHRWLGNLIRKKISTCNSLKDLTDTDEIPGPLMQLFQIEAAKTLCKRNPEDESNYVAIADALKSSDEEITKKALRIRNFFNGRNKKFTNVEYFLHHLFPYVSLNTRVKIIKTLAHSLPIEHSSLAEEFFMVISETYGVSQAVPLLIACQESFAFEKITKHRLVLNLKMMKDLFYRRHNLAVRYLKLTTLDEHCDGRIHNIPIHKYRDFVVKLIKNSPDAFVEIYESHCYTLKAFSLSRKSAEKLLKTHEKDVREKPKMYIQLLPITSIRPGCMEVIFSRLFPDYIGYFDTDLMLRYLQVYPRDKKLSLLTESYKQVYGKDLFDDNDNVTAELLKLLPVERRIQLARIKMLGKTNNSIDPKNYDYIWRCFLSSDEAIESIKKEISMTSDLERRTALFGQMLYVCKINMDDSALLEVLGFIRNHHVNDKCITEVLNILVNMYDVLTLSADHWKMIFDILRPLPLKWRILDVLESAIRYRIFNKSSYDDIIDMIVRMNDREFIQTWNILKDHPQHEKKCLEDFLIVLLKRINTQKIPEDMVSYMVLRFAEAVYDFNERHVKRGKTMERLSVKNYPLLMEKIEEIIGKGFFEEYHGFQRLFRKHDIELYGCFWDDNDSRNIEDVNEALETLKKTPEVILENWEKYVNWCIDFGIRRRCKKKKIPFRTCCRGIGRRDGLRGREVPMKKGKICFMVRPFVKATRWYNGIPMKFVERLVENVKKKRCGVSLRLLAVLVRGETFADLVLSLVSTETDGDESLPGDSGIWKHIGGVKFANPPVPLHVITQLCERRFSLARKLLVNTCRRSRSNEVMTFLKNLPNSDRLSVRKAKIKLLQMVAPREKLLQILSLQWKTEKCGSIRKLLMFTVLKIFLEDSSATSWSLLVETILNLQPEDNKFFSDLIKASSKIPKENIEDYLHLLLKALENFKAAGLYENIVNNHAASLLRDISYSNYHFLPDNFLRTTLKRFLQSDDSELFEVAKDFLTNFIMFSNESTDSSMNLFSHVFTELVKAGWEVSQPEEPSYFPVKDKIRILIEHVVAWNVAFEKKDPEFFEVLLATFLSVLTPKMDARSYLTLEFAKEIASARTSKELGLKVADKTVKLQGMFSFSVKLMSGALNFLLERRLFREYRREEVMLDVAEALIENGGSFAALIAVYVLPKDVEEEDARKYEEIVKKLKESDDTAVKAAFSELRMDGCSF